MVNIGTDVKKRFLDFLAEQEYSLATIQKYRRNLDILTDYAGDYLQDKAHLNGFRQYLLERNFSSGTINSIIGTVNKLLAYLESTGEAESKWKMRYEKIQRRNFIPVERELTREEYERMVNKARELGDTRLLMLIQTICALGICVGEVRFITAESLDEGQATIRNKRKERKILIPQVLIKMLKAYCASRNITSGPVFITRSGKPLDRSNIWRMMKRLGEAANIEAKKVFPHNLRHLFARSYYKEWHDIAGLAAILGHSGVDTTRIYTANSGQREREYMNRLNLAFLS